MVLNACIGGELPTPSDVRSACRGIGCSGAHDQRLRPSLGSVGCTFPRLIGTVIQPSPLRRHVPSLQIRLNPLPLVPCRVHVSTPRQPETPPRPACETSRSVSSAESPLRSLPSPRTSRPPRLQAPTEESSSTPPSLTAPAAPPSSPSHRTPAESTPGRVCPGTPPPHPDPRCTRATIRRVGRRTLMHRRSAA